jgi:Domain of Unknown Function (DUF1206)
VFMQAAHAEPFVTSGTESHRLCLSPASTLVTDSPANSSDPRAVRFPWFPRVLRVETGMQPKPIADVTRIARRASDGSAAQTLPRAGLAARGVIYILIGWVAVLAALGRSSREADQQSALQLLARKPYGLVSLWLLGIGFAAYVLWRLSERPGGGHGHTPSRWPARR